MVVAVAVAVAVTVALSTATLAASRPPPANVRATYTNHYKPENNMLFSESEQHILSEQ